VLHHRLAAATVQPVRHDGLTIQRRAPRRIAGLIPEAAGSMTDEYRRALREQAALIEQRVTDLVQDASRDHEPWLSALAPEPGDNGARHVWQAAARTIAAYRDRYYVTDSALLGNEPIRTDAQATDAARVVHAVQYATQIRQRPKQRPDGADRAHDYGISR
jgi:hypothetical protein